MSGLRTIIIVGAGFSGTAVARCLLKNPYGQALHLILIERGGAFARGLAYARRDFPYLLNVPASRMSATAGDANQFLDFARRQRAQAQAHEFMPRSLYGDYLNELLDNAESTAPRSARLLRCQDEAVAIERRGFSDSLIVRLRSGRTLVADDVVIATGNPPPSELPVAGAVRYRPAYVADPWNTNLEFAGTQRVFIVGTGLTMADIVTRLTEQNATTRIYAISRHGRLAPPQQQLQTDALSDGVIAQMLNSATVRDLMKSARFVATAAAALGGDWREVVNAIRHFAPTFWRRFSPEDRGRFLRHVRSHWDVFRHRLAPRAYQQICTARQREQLHIGAGRICEIVPADQAIRVRWTPRGATETREQEVDTVINCTGPEYRPSRSRDPLLRQLLDSGLATEDAHALGLRTGKHGELIGHNGVPSSNLYYIGPMLRAEHWEATAVAELRLHAEQLAAHLAAKVAVNRGATARPVDSIDQSIVALEHLS